MGRLQRSRTIPAVDGRPAWSVVCFIERAGHRRQGMASAMLEGPFPRFSTMSGLEVFI
jgi:hypothetical protein